VLWVGFAFVLGCFELALGLLVGWLWVGFGFVLCWFVGWLWVGSK